MLSVSLRRVLPLLLLVISGCKSTGTDVHATFDKQADFTTLHTYAFASVPAAAQTSIGDTSLIEMIAAQLEAVGLSRTDRLPDLLVAVHRSNAGRLNTSGWGYEFHEGRMEHYELQEGTLVIDLVDSKSKESVWRGTANGVFRADMTQTEKRKLATDVLQQMFAGYPPKR
jgi:hypothetical protein